MRASVGVFGGLAFCMLLASSAAVADKPAPDLSRPYFAFDVFKLEEAERLLSMAAAAGYQIVDARRGFRAGWSTGGYAFLMEKRPATAEPIEYRLLVRREPDRLAEALNAGAVEGFRLIDAGVYHQIRGGAGFVDWEFVAIMERSAGTQTGRHYRAVTGTPLQAAIDQVLQQGYDVVGVAGGKEDPLVIAEKSFPGTAGEGTGYRILQAGGIRGLGKQLAAAVAEGARVAQAANPGGGHLLLLRTGGDADPVEYFLPRPKMLLVDIKGAGGRGYRLLPQTLDTVPTMERPPGSKVRYEYVVAEDDREDLDSRGLDLSEWTAKGFRAVRLFSASDVILERELGGQAGEPADGGSAPRR